MPASASDRPAGSEVSDYRLAPLLAARLVGGLLVVVAVLLLVVTVVVGSVGASADWVVLAAVVGVVLVLAAGYVLVRRLTVVHLGPDGYRVRLGRGAGVPRAGWREVTEAMTSVRGDVPVVVLKLHDGRSTTIPVQVLAADREDFVRDLQRHLQDGQGLRPL